MVVTLVYNRYAISKPSLLKPVAISRSAAIAKDLELFSHLYNSL
jgi:hypothetical protein